MARGRIECPGLTVVESVDCDVLLHAHAGAQFTLVVGGTVVDRGEGFVFQQAAGAVVYRPPGAVHQTVESTGARVLRIEIPEIRFAAINCCAGDLFRAPALFSSRELGAYPEQVHAEMRRGCPLFVEARVLALIGRVADVLRQRTFPRRPRWLEEALLLLRMDPCRRFTVPELAAEVGVGRDQFAEALASFEGRTLRELALEARLEAARQALLRTSRGIADIATDTGFTDHAHLTNAFRKTFGMTPSRYRMREG